MGDNQIGAHDVDSSNVIAGSHNKQVIEQHYHGISEAVFERYVSELSVTKAALSSFFKILEQAAVPIEDLDSKLRNIAQNHKQLLQNIQLLEQSEDDAVQGYLCQAQQFIEGKDDDIDFDKADELLQKAFEQELKGVEQKQISAAKIVAQRGELAGTQLKYKQAGIYFQQAAELLLESYEQKVKYLNSASNNFYCAGLYEQGLFLSQHAVDIGKQKLGAQHGDYAESLNNLAKLYHAKGQYQQALPLFQQASDIYREMLGKQHLDYATSLNNLALLYESQGQYQQALPLYQQALEIKEQVLGKQHPDYASSLNNLAALYQSQSQYEQALPLYQQALEIKEQVLGKQHPSYATSLNNLAGLYRAQGQYQQALPLYLEDLRITGEVLGKQHPSYATS
ncbi:tetratricopeptide repeat protein, partial [Candidatus Albibeggiatoa sp. nov. NOAA]|uniref:tetratricopeptide repeat protein n=1 Tax=Candidatus Albibeggiatoa sp. nov. NOAA TaxID=3162724 RepID=UPI0032FFC683|nr:tetratricopeptide repeat protein [Thiotrichaceae bacterium]